MTQSTQVSDSVVVSAAEPRGKPVISVRQYAAGDREHVAKLFHEVMLTKFTDPSSEFHAPWREYAQKRLRTDLADIPGTYIAPGGNFWVAVASDPDGAQGERIAGIVGLERKSESEGEVRSVFVSVDHHRLGVGRELMTRLMDWARAHGYARLFLTTTAANTQSRAFYESLGFRHQAHAPPLAFFDGRLELAKYVKLL